MLGDTDINAFASVIGGANSKRCKFYSATRANLTNRDDLLSGNDDYRFSLYTLRLDAAEFIDAASLCSRH